MRYIRLGSDRSYLLSRITYTLEARKLVRQMKPDLVVEDFSPYSPVLASRYFDGPSIAVVNVLPGWNAVRHIGPLGVVSLFAEMDLHSTYRHFIAGSQSVYRELTEKARLDSDVVLIPNGIDPYFLEPHDTPEENFILFVGRLDIYQKGIDTLLKSFQLLSEEHPEIRLVIAGDGPDEGKVKRLIRDLGLEGKVDMVGHVGLERRELYRRCLFAVCPSRFEGFGLVALEAQACGKEVVGSRIPGLDEAIRHNKTGLLVPPNEPLVLAGAMDCLISCPHIRKECGEQGRAWASRFSWDESARKQVEFFQGVIG
ncbi:glycosyltransferase family 4 protein [Candidatus Magnetobacterium casensis]|uniref:Glycosyltransferase family 4 protein n=2 Tax=Candidatus Magnetobacterium casense TaxID=1455061 RepID=A0ABS6S510_9BACT|nr:glycosyltransferase family 4 protein [Candidatus Magnetobacterium casensis]